VLEVGGVGFIAIKVLFALYFVEVKGQGGELVTNGLYDTVNNTIRAKALFNVVALRVGNEYFRPVRIENPNRTAHKGLPVRKVVPPCLYTHRPIQVN
jgi:hypothetical protein